MAKKSQLTIPPPVRGAYGRWSQVAASMAVGDSELVADYNELQAIRQALQRLYGKGSCASRKEGTGFRAWRIEPKVTK